MADADLDPRLRELVELAERVRGNAYARYSNFHVGAALRTLRGGVYSGSTWKTRATVPRSAPSVRRSRPWWRR